MDLTVITKAVLDLEYTSADPRTWSPKKRGKALYIISTLANTPSADWASKNQIWEALKDFRATPQNREE
jgi:hypothetical protein